MLFRSILTEQRFLKLTATLEQEQEANRKRIQELALVMRRTDEQESDVSYAGALCQRICEPVSK